MRLSDEVIKAFVKKVDRDARIGPDGDCWDWIGAKHNFGYGHIFFDGRVHKAHRVSYQINHGLIPDGMMVRHKCDVPCCTNPDHLVLGTQIENVADMLVRHRNRPALGTSHGMAKLSESDVAEIFSLKGKAPQKEIGAMFGVNFSTVSDIHRGRIWCHITGLDRKRSARKTPGPASLIADSLANQS